MFVEKTPGEYAQELKSKRESLGLTLDDVFQKTRIRTSYLRAIENSEYDVLPDPVYTRNFIKTYAKFLGVSDEPLLKHYEDYIQSRDAENQNLRKQHSEEKALGETAVKNKIYGWVFAAVIAVLAIWLFMKQTSLVTEGPLSEIKPLEKQTQQAIPANSSNINPIPPQTQADAGTKEAIPTEAGSNLTAQDQENRSVSLEKKQFIIDNKVKDLVITALEETWIRVQAEGEETSTEVLLKPGDKLVKQGEAFRLDIGNAGGISITFKGKSIDNIGKKGEVVHIRIPQ